MRHLPFEIVFHIIEFSNIESIFALDCTCIEFHHFIQENEEVIFKPRCKLFFKTSLERLKQKTWKEYCIIKLEQYKIENMIYLKNNIHERVEIYYPSFTNQIILFKSEKEVGLKDRRYKKVVYGYQESLFYLSMFWDSSNATLEEVVKIGVLMIEKGGLIEKESQWKEDIIPNISLLPCKKGNIYSFCTNQGYFCELNFDHSIQVKLTYYGIQKEAEKCIIN